MALTVNMAAVRHYCVHASPSTGLDILTDAVVTGDLGACHLVQMICEVRHNRRTRHTLGEVRTQLTRPASQRPRWISTLSHSVFALWRVLRRQALPRTDVTPHHGQIQSLPRAVQRMLRPSGMAATAELGLAARAATAAQRIWGAVRGTQCVLWLDNFCWLRWGTDPSRPNYSQNLTALAVLNLDALHAHPVRTRAGTIPWFPGHRRLDTVVTHVPWAAALCCSAAQRLHTVVNGLGRLSIPHASIRVPLDIQRTDVTSLGWAPLSLT